MKKTIAWAAGLAAALLALSACGGPAPSVQVPAEPDSTPEKTYKIAITKFVAHPSLDAIAQGFKDELSAKGVKAEYVEDDALAEVPNTTTIAGKYAADPSIELIVAIATPSAAAVVNAVSDRPVLYAGVTDPVAAQLVKDWEASGTNVAGASDLNPEGYPLALIQETLGKDKVAKVGFPYTLTEKNSVVQLDLLKQEAGSGVEVVPAGVANSSELMQGLESLKSAGVDAIHVGTDNTVV
ncbi:MAG: sugar ABC transporter substrate-binding protein, partial [Propionibacteriaceae bacterium]|nr:sugar ABC transporter substrate-binding protein [Propionibacteriaceae bacterium]